MQQIVPVILSGGSGTRLWPVSRKSFPKQFWPLISEHSLLAETALRAASPAFTAPIVVANQEHRFVVAEQLRKAGVQGAQILLEPVGRNSAPAIAAAALLAAESNPEAVLWIMAADAAISDLKALHGALETARAAAQAGYFVTFGMQPTGPETGYGYIAQGAEMPGLEGVFKLDRFIEKPSAEKAAKLFAADITKKIAARWSSDVSGGGEVHLTVKNVDSLKQAAELKAGLLNFVRGVKAVNSRGFNHGVAELDVTLVGSTDDFAAELEAKKLGSFTLRVKGVSANTVSAEIGK